MSNLQTSLLTLRLFEIDIFVSIALLVDANLQLWEVKSTELIPASVIAILNFIHQEIPFDAFLCGFTVVINKADHQIQVVYILSM